MQLRQQTLEDKYTLKKGRIFCNGLQAIVRLLITQHQLDAQNGLNTGGFVSGYRGSPLGGLDLQLWQARRYLKAADVIFNPGLNEDLAATSIWGTQQMNFFEGPEKDGVFGLWYGKGPGVDRSVDALKHANHAGTTPNGGVLVLAGDDHACKSSSLPHQSDQALVSAGIPILAPSTLQEVVDYGLLGYAMSRYSGCWVGMKLVSDTIEAAGTLDVGTDKLNIKIPQGVELPGDGVHIRWPDTGIAQEKRLYDYKLPAAQAFARENKVDKWIAGSSKKPAKLGIVTSGKSYHDVIQALQILGLESKDLEKAGVRLLKLGLVWPVDSKIMQDFAESVNEILVVEEKRPLIEDQIKTVLYEMPTEQRPLVAGKKTPAGERLLSSIYELTVHDIAKAILLRAKAQKVTMPGAPKCLEAAAHEDYKQVIGRLPFYCSGCPHNTSTRQLPEGSRALAGIGCHYMAMWITDFTQTSTHMGGEGVPWIGASPFVKEDHVFVNMGDGTYYHSGSLAIRAAVAANVNATYKILFNDAVAMTGGQPLDGPLTVPGITQQVAAEGVKAIAVVSDEPDKYPTGADFAAGVTFHHRDDLHKVQEDFKTMKGVTVIIYDQTCAAEKRRRRKRGLMEDPPKRVFINDAVCEGCGDCGKVSNCVSIQPLETEFGTKRTIDQTSCNKDYSCIKGFCPSFVTIEGDYKGAQTTDTTYATWIAEAVKKIAMPEATPEDRHARVMLMAGVGGTGIVTVGALVGMAAHLEGKACTIMDQTGLAQKGGAVYSHVKVAANQEQLHTHKVAAGEADLLLGCDSLVASAPWACSTVQPGKTHVIINDHQMPHSNFTKDRDFKFPEADVRANLHKASAGQHLCFFEAEKLVEKALGGTQYMNLFMLGAAFQKGALGLHLESLLEVIRLNGVSVENNTLAFNLGRLAAEDMALVEEALQLKNDQKEFQPLEELDDIVRFRREQLQSYQDALYAYTYTDKVRQMEAAEQRVDESFEKLTKAVAKNYHKLLAYKDEYEVARLFTQTDFKKKLAAQYAPGFKMSFYLAPPFLTAAGPGMRPKKIKFGGWVWMAFKLLAKFKRLRGTRFDPFGYTWERKQERALIKRYEALMLLVRKTVKRDVYELALPLLTWPERIRGYGPVKEESIKKTLAEVEAAETKYRAALQKGLKAVK